MQTSIPLQGAGPQASIAVIPAAEGTGAGVSWSAVLAGALAAAALSFILLILGVGLGLSALSPWSYNDAPIGKSAIIWVAFMQLASAGIGGYLAGRLRGPMCMAMKSISATPRTACWPGPSLRC
jgi:hypothetical protein